MQHFKKEIGIRIIKIIIFVMLLVILFGQTLPILNYKDMGGGGGWERFYDTSRNTIDVMVYGSSRAHCSIDHGTLWDDYGITGFTLSSGSQPISSTAFFVGESLKYQHPQVLLVEIGMALNQDNSLGYENAYRDTLGAHWSMDLWKYIKYMQNSMLEDNEWGLQMFSKFPIIHGRYEELAKEDYVDATPYLKGYRGSFEQVSYDVPDTIFSQDCESLAEENEDVLKQIINIAYNNEIPLIFWLSPSQLSLEEKNRANSIAQLAEDNNIMFIDFNSKDMIDVLGLNYSVDFRDETHLNNNGAKKITCFWAEYLQSEYNIKNHKQEENYEIEYKGWIDNSRYLDNLQIKHELEMTSDINEYLKECAYYVNKGYTVIISLDGYYTALGDAFFEGRTAIGITDTFFESGGTYVISQECVKAYDGIEYVDIYNQMNKGTENGLNMIVYDMDLDMIIDSAYDDVFMGLEVERM